MSEFSMMQERDVIKQPYFMLIINGVLVPAEQHKKIAEISIEDFDEKLDLARITILDNGDYYFVNNPDLVKDATIVIGFGHVRNYRTMLSGIISLVEATFEQNGIAKVIISAIDSGVTMSKEKKTKKWEKKKISDVVSEVCSLNGLFVKVIDTKVILPQITQNDESDLSFLYRLSFEMGYTFYCIDEGTYFFGYADMKDPPVATLNYRQGDCSIISFSFNFESKGDSVSDSNSNIDANTGETESRSDEITNSTSLSPINRTNVSTSTGAETTIGTGKDFIR